MYFKDLDDPKRQQFVLDCQVFSIGRWTKNAPTVPGVYATADLQGNPGPYIELRIWNDRLVRYKDGAYVTAQHAWTGWWWTSPVPNLPSPPKD